MKDNWFDPKFVEEWDTKDSKAHPIRKEQLAILTDLISENYQPGSSILDIGCGSGLVEEMIYSKIPKAKIIAIDFSQPMLEIAAKRLAGKDFTSIQKDIDQLEIADLPKGSYTIAFSAYATHELNKAIREKLFKKIYEILEPGAQFFIVDRVKTDLDKFESSYKVLWKKVYEMGSLTVSNFSKYRDAIKSKEDSPGTLEEYRAILTDAGFESAILHLYFDRALMVGLKGKS